MADTNPAPASFFNIFNNVRSGTKSPIADIFSTAPVKKGGKRTRKVRRSNNRRKTVK